MNPFDAGVAALALIAVVAGFRSGLLRSLATIFAYVLAVAIAVAVMPMAAPVLAPIVARTIALPGLDAPAAQNGVVFAGLVIVLGLILGAMLRGAIGVTAGPQIGIGDRMAGAVLGALRILFLAVLLVLIFERIVPPGQQPEVIAGSRLRPLLSAAGAAGLRTLPPSVEAQIEKLKRERGL